MVENRPSPLLGHWLIQQLVRDSPIANAAYKIIAIKNSNNNNKIIILNSGKSIFANVCPSVKNVYCVFFMFTNIIHGFYATYI